MCNTFTALSRLSVVGCVYVIIFKTLLGHGQDFSDLSLCINIRSTNQLHVQYFSSLWKMTFRGGKNIICCFTMIHVNGLMQIVLFNSRIARMRKERVVDTMWGMALDRLVDSCKLFFNFRLLSAFDSFWQAINKRYGDLCC